MFSQLSCNDVFSFIWIQGFCNMDITLSLCKWFPLKAVLEISALNWVKTVSVIGILLFPKALKFFSRRANCGSRGNCLISTWFCGVMYCCLLSSFISWATQTGTHVRFHVSFITADNFISWPVVDNSPLMSLRTLVPIVNLQELSRWIIIRLLPFTTAIQLVLDLSNSLEHFMSHWFCYLSSNSLKWSQYFIFFLVPLLRKSGLLSVLWFPSICFSFR